MRAKVENTNWTLFEEGIDVDEVSATNSLRFSNRPSLFPLQRAGWRFYKQHLHNESVNQEAQSCAAFPNTRARFRL